MGSAKTSDTKPQLPVNEFSNKKTIKHILTSLFHKDKKKNKPTVEEVVENVQITVKNDPVIATPVKNLLETFGKLNLNQQDDIDDELKNFTIKNVGEGRINRYDSNSSQDSGFLDKISLGDDKDEKKGFNDKTVAAKDDIAECLDNLTIIRNDDTKKKVQTVFVPRQPIRNNLHGNAVHPYQQISQINKQTFSGGQVIVNSQNTPQSVTHDEANEISQALLQIDAIVSNFHQIPVEEQAMFFQTATDYVIDDTLLSDFGEEVNQKPQEIMQYPLTNCDMTPNPIEEFNTNLFNAFDNFDSDPMGAILTPPRSNEPQFSPLSAQSPSFYSPPRKYVTDNSPQTDYTLSPDRQSPNNFQHEFDSENYQHIDEFPISVNFDSNNADSNIKKSTISMKNIKEAQKGLTAGFSKHFCCNKNSLSIKKAFYPYFHKLSSNEKKNICMKVAGMDFKTAYGVLHHILLSLSSEVCEQDTIQYVIFYLLCHQVLAQKPMLFLKEFGLNLLIAASIRCYFRLELTRLLVHCIRVALKDTERKGPLFIEVDSRGDNLLGALARCGDSHADVLSAILIRTEEEIPLFDIDHANTEGYSALHMACISHNIAEVGNCIHTVHVLLAHGKADIYKGDLKVGDTALHLAVNSVTCDLKLIQNLFLHVDRKTWKHFAHTSNRSSVKPIDYARSATRSTVRQNYPHEVLDMLKKFR